MKKIVFSSIFLGLVFLTSLQAQKHRCGVNAQMGAMIVEQMLENRNEMRDFVQLRNATVYLPVRFFLVAESDGSKRIPETTALLALCNLNNNFAEQEIQFYLKEFKYLNNTALFTNAMSNSAFNTIKSQMIYNAINIFLVEDAGGGAAAFYQPPSSGLGRNDWIVSSASYADDFETLTHEMGHFFTLPHPFNGWEPEPWNLQLHGSPVGLFASDNQTRNEFANGSNCATAGDMICDTPADYRFDFPGPDGCTYNQQVKDPNGEFITPDLTNFMNYASCANNLYHFTDMQKEEMNQSLNSSSRNYIPKNFVPASTEPITQTPTLLSPQNLQTVATYNHVPLEWTAVPNATKYVLEVTHSTNGRKIYLVDENKVTLTDLVPQSNYFWKVKAYNEYATCASTSGQRIFKTGADLLNDTNEIPGLSAWSVSPNPVKSGQFLLLNIESEQGVTVDLMLTTITGQNVMMLKDQKLANGTSTLEIETANLPGGVYLVSIRTQDGILTKRVSII